jgi:hypothetical protein
MSLINHQTAAAMSISIASGKVKNSNQSQAPPPVPSFHISPSVHNEVRKARTKGRIKRKSAA